MLDTKNRLIVYELDKNSISKDCIKNIANLHMQAFPDFFLTKLGSVFLRALYTGYMEDDNSGIIVVADDDKIVGFTAYSKEYSKFFKGLIKKQLFKFGMCAAIATIRHPSFARRLLGALKKSDSVVKKEPYIELASICVDPSIKGMGIGSMMISYLIEITDFSKFEYINLETDAENNDDVNKFYIKNGFNLARQYKTAEKRKMNEYRYGEKNESSVH
jgi:ribosomal protein S18 acetylase RimI-like enzyme